MITCFSWALSLELSITQTWFLQSLKKHHLLILYWLRPSFEYYVFLLTVSGDQSWVYPWSIIINPTAFLNKACPALPLIGFPQYSMRSVTRVQLQADEGFPSPPSVLNVSVHLKVLKVKEVTVCTQAPNWVVCASPRAQTTFSNRGQQSFVYLWLWHNPYHHNQQKLPIRGWIHLVKGQSES